MLGERYLRRIKYRGKGCCADGEVEDIGGRRESDQDGGVAAGMGEGEGKTHPHYLEGVRDATRCDPMQLEGLSHPLVFPGMETVISPHGCCLRQKLRAERVTALLLAQIMAQDWCPKMFADFD